MRESTPRSEPSNSVLFAHLSKVSGNFFKLFDIQASVTLGALKDRYHRLCGRVTIGHGHGRDCGVDIINARFNTFGNGAGRQTRGGMGMELNGNSTAFLSL